MEKKKGEPKQVRVISEMNIFLYVGFNGKVVITDFCDERPDPYIPYFGLQTPVSCYLIKGRRIFGGEKR